MPANAAVARPADSTFLLDVFTETSPFSAADEFGNRSRTSSGNGRDRLSERQSIGQVVRPIYPGPGAMLRRAMRRQQ
jgi:hypothetical protein